MESELRKILNLTDDKSFLADLARRPRLQRTFQSPPQLSDSQKTWFCWSLAPALLELTFHKEKLSPESISKGRIELPRYSNKHQIEILLDQKFNELPEFWIEIQELSDVRSNIAPETRTEH